MKYISVFLLLALISIFAVSCGDKSIPSEGEVTKTLELISGSGQIAPAGSFLTDSLSVRVKDNNDMPIENAVVKFTQITPNDGGYFPGSWNEVTTDSNGLAYAYYYLDTIVGVDTIKAELVEDSTEFVYFVETVTASDSVIMAIDFGNNQLNPAGERLPDSCVVFVKDRYNNPASGHLVRFVSEDRCVVATDSTSSFETDTAYTYSDENGKAWAIWYLTINNPITPYTLRAYSMISDSILDLVLFGSLSTAPSTLEYYNDIRSIFEQPMNCMSCHSGSSRGGDYTLEFYYELLKDDNLIPGDTNSSLLTYVNSDHKLGSINMVEVDKVIRWVVTDNAVPGSSGKLNYQSDIRPILEDRCTKLCHTTGQLGEEYLMDSHSGIRDTGLEVTPNAIPGDSSSLLVQKLLVGGSMLPYLSPDTALADLIINWIVDDSLRQY